MTSFDMNILILSCGIRNKIIQYFKKELAGRGLVIAADCNNLAPALYDADRHFIIPGINETGYLDSILTLCKENKVKAVLSLIDPELSILSKHRQAFLDIGTIPVVSDYDVVEMCLNKYSMYKFLVDNHFKSARSYISKDAFYSDVENGAIDYPVFVKPVDGSASININKVTSKDEIELLFNRFDNLLIQEYMRGAEYGVDAYIDLISGEPAAIFIKKKIKMRAGETDKSVSVIDDRFFEFIRSFIVRAGFKGVIDIDIFESDGEYYISEVNPRFGGGYPHAYECGVNIPRMIINNVSGIINNDVTGRYEEGIYMMKFSEVKVMKL